MGCGKIKQSPSMIGNYILITKEKIFQIKESENLKFTSLKKLLKIVEFKFGIQAVVPAANFLLSQEKLYKHTLLARLLFSAGVIKNIERKTLLPDEPPVKIWGSKLNSSGDWAGGASFDDNTSIIKTLAEAIERQIWFDATDYFIDPVYAGVNEVGRRGGFIHPLHFVGFSEAQRAASPLLTITEESKFHWIKGHSLLNNNSTYIPAQLVSPKYSLTKNREPIIRQCITTGLATWPTQLGARLAGILEVIERDAYMIMWLNQLTLPRVDMGALSQKTSASLSQILASCERYRLSVTFVPLLTDAPTHAVMAVVEDESGHKPRFTIGTSAHYKFDTAAEGALLEALRARITCRKYVSEGRVWDSSKPVDTIGHIERLYYWTAPENAQALEFLIRGKIVPPPYNQSWENDTENMHYARMKQWIKENNYECVAVSFSRSKYNVTDWKIEMVVMPNMFPMHITEKFRYLGGEKRLRDVPVKYGYVPATEPFVDRPHPFC